MWILPITALALLGTGRCFGQAGPAAERDSALLSVRLAKYLLQGDGVPESHVFSEVRLVYPEFPDSTEAARRAGKLIEQQLANLLNVNLKKEKLNLEEASRKFLLKFREHKKKNPDTKGIWFITLLSDTLYRSDRVLTLELQQETYAGGAHPNSTRLYYTFDRRTGKVLKPRDLFTNIPAVTKIADRIFREARRIRGTDDLRRHSFRFKDGRFHLPDNVGVTKSGVMLYFNPDEVAPYSVGGILIALPIHEIRPYLKVK